MEDEEEEMEEEDFIDEAGVETEVKPIPKKEPGVSHKAEDLPQGEEDCYWCGRAIDVKQTRQARMHDMVVYICKDC